MAEGQLVTSTPPFQLAPITGPELLTANFYSWEVRGRGWELWDWPVVLEPPFTPFFSHGPLTPALAIDDARKPSVLGSFLGRFRKRQPQPLPAVPFWPADLGESAPELASDTSALLALQVAPPAALKISRETAEQFLLSLSPCSRPVSSS
jgi:hypothetical protein